MSYHKRCNTFNKNPALVVRHFPYRVELFFKTILLDGPLGKANYYAIRVEFEKAHIFIHLSGFQMHPNLVSSTQKNIQTGLIWLSVLTYQILPVNQT